MYSRGLLCSAALVGLVPVLSYALPQDNKASTPVAMSTPVAGSNPVVVSTPIAVPTPVTVPTPGPTITNFTNVTDNIYEFKIQHSGFNNPVGTCRLDLSNATADKFPDTAAIPCDPPTYRYNLTASGLCRENGGMRVMHTVQRDDGKSAEVAVSFSDYARPASVKDWPQEMATHPIAFYCARAKGDNSFPAPAGWAGDAQSSNAMIKNVVNKLTIAAAVPTIPDEVFPTRQ